ncbi:hypothetical protein C0053_19200 [Pseudomonas aeruginosa]|uniref:Toxin YhaV n=1 Tax=Pseudomonas aeruginosa TaxID=287 RepID=A0A0P0ACM1_PSEAI|nr:toxin YhaV [Pseudomonas aeruginosa]ERU44892.1 hypothetical protein Q093_00102 [Pseudomonas aeruginosa CF614]ERV56225.1 hypothetical protein Q065_02919 [Pseudomonas aeruginosa BL11]ERY54668.1 hypothetical protein Q060_02139 [Pseudomonas aeruginosa BL06]ETV41728.1 hypothetical protein Q046_01654 [Pseudomonas aeruginosa BWHPSA041]SSU86468.1 Toxin YhaV [Acinetobacter baumannii]
MPTENKIDYPALQKRSAGYAWVNDENTLRSAGSKSDPYAVFEKILGRGNPPDDWMR